MTSIMQKPAARKVRRAELLRRRAEHGFEIAVIDKELATIEESEPDLTVYYHQHNSPLDSHHVFLRKARDGAFPTVRIGKRVLVERAVFDAWLASQPRPVRKVKREAPAESGPALADEVLAELGAKRIGGVR